MGRKPNPLILEYFNRGPKLEDSSNRYQHSCKACGEKFPKGRIDSLQAHLVKKCSALSDSLKTKALLQINNLPGLPDTSSGSATASAPALELPVGNRDWTALETLAEVSRQIEISEKHDDRSQQNHSAGPRGKTEEPPRMDRFELQEQWTPDNPPLSYDARQQRDKKMTGQKLTARRDSEATLPPANFHSRMSASPSGSPSMNMAAAKSLAVAASARFVPVMLDPQLLGEGLPELSQPAISMDADMSQTSNSLSFVHGDGQEVPAWPMLDGTGRNMGSMYPDPTDFENNIDHQARANGFTRTLSMNPGMTTEFSAEYGNGQKSNRPKVRGRFTPLRRKEVQEVRKRGACMRCRMLKKPCSGDNPCATCRNVESARVWKHACIRTRVAEELDMYSSGLHAVIAHREVQAVRSRVNLQPSANQVDASHYPETAVCATFRALEGQEVPQAENIDPSLGLEGGTAIIRMLDNDNDDLPMKVEAYMKRMSSVFFEKEPSHFMHVTLNTALEVSIAKQDPLLAKALDLWSTVHMLVDHELKWFTYYKTSMDGEASQGIPIEEDQNYQLICMQLNAAVEKKAHTISKTVLTDLERRFMSKSLDTAFETLLTGLILLNCVEKSTWLYKSWEQDYLNSRWPLEKSPTVYGSQGDTFTDMLCMLLRIRSVAPKTYHRIGDGMVATESYPEVQEYLEKLHLNYAELVEKRDNPTFDPADSRCYELRFCSRVLIGDATSSD